MLDPGIDIARRIPTSVEACVAEGMPSAMSHHTNSVVYHPLLLAIPQSALLSTPSYVEGDHADSLTIA